MPKHQTRTTPELLDDYLTYRLLRNETLQRRLLTEAGVAPPDACLYAAMDGLPQGADVDYGSPAYGAYLVALGQARALTAAQQYLDELRRLEACPPPPPPAPAQIDGKTAAAGGL